MRDRQTRLVTGCDTVRWHADILPEVSSRPLAISHPREQTTPCSIDHPADAGPVPGPVMRLVPGRPLSVVASVGGCLAILGRIAALAVTAVQFSEVVRVVVAKPEDLSAASGLERVPLPVAVAVFRPEPAPDAPRPSFRGEAQLQWTTFPARPIAPANVHLRWLVVRVTIQNPRFPDCQQWFANFVCG